VTDAPHAIRTREVREYARLRGTTQNGVKFMAKKTVLVSDLSGDEIQDG